MAEQFTQDQWATFEQDYPPGTVVRGQVINVAHYGMYIRLDELPGIPALLEIIQMPHQVLPVRYPDHYPALGDRIEARIMAWVPGRGVTLTQLDQNIVDLEGPV